MDNAADEVFEALHFSIVQRKTNAFPAESAYGEMLHDALGDEGIRVVQLVIPGSIHKLKLENGIDDVAERIWSLHAASGPFREMLIPLEHGQE